MQIDKQTFEILPEKYMSPRVTGEVLDCSMPMTFDTYNNCGFHCLYCFSTFQRSIGGSAENYKAQRVKKVSAKKFKWFFTELENPKNPFKDLIKNRITLQFGGLSDPFCPIEEQEELGLEILTFLKEIKYPVCFSSKGDLMLRDKRYMDLFVGMGDYWSYKASIITWDAEKAKIMEAGTPSPQQRMKVLEELGKLGIWTVLRMRPFVIGLTGNLEKGHKENREFETMLREAGRIGVKALSTEFFCLELRSMNVAKDKYDLMSKVIGFDIVQFYKNVSSTSGYLRLNYSIKEKYIKEMERICKEEGINYHVSDAHHKEKGASGSCCGLPANDKFGFSKCQFTYALWYAKEHGEVKWNDIAKHDVWMKNMSPLKAPGFNTGSNERREKKFSGVSMFEFMRNAWNDPKNANSPYRYFAGILIPDRLDEEDNIIYKFDYKKANLLDELPGCKGC